MKCFIEDNKREIKQLNIAIQILLHLFVPAILSVAAQLTIGQPKLTM
jgi:hypothetical protein